MLLCTFIFIFFCFLIMQLSSDLCFLVVIPCPLPPSPQKKTGNILFIVLTLLGGFNFQVVLGGPFLPHIEQILRDKASLMSSPVVLASDSGKHSKINGISLVDGRPCQSCDIIIQVDRDIKLVCTFIFMYD